MRGKNLSSYYKGCTYHMSQEKNGHFGYDLMWDQTILLWHAQMMMYSPYTGNIQIVLSISTQYKVKTIQISSMVSWGHIWNNVLLTLWLRHSKIKSMKYSS